MATHKNPSRQSLAAIVTAAVAFTINGKFYPNSNGNLVSAIEDGTDRDEDIVSSPENDEFEAITLGDLLDAGILPDSTTLLLPDGRRLEVLIEHKAVFATA